MIFFASRRGYACVLPKMLVVSLILYPTTGGSFNLAAHICKQQLKTLAGFNF